MTNTEDKDLNQPYIHIRRIGEQFQVSGTSVCTLGHKLQSEHLDKADGIFGEWVWDGQNLKIQNDRYGFYPLYYFAGRDEFALSPSLPKLVSIGAPTELNYAGLAVFLRLGFFLGEDTPFLGIHAVPPDATVEWCQGELRVSSTTPNTRTLGLTRTSAIDAYISLFREAIRRRTPPDGDCCVLLSGGRDSRHILLELVSSGFRPRFTLTVRADPCGNADVEIARSLSEAIHVTHVVVNRTGKLFNSQVRKNHQTNFCSIDHGWLSPAVEYLKGKPYTLYDGIGGDILSAGLFLDEHRMALFEAEQLYELAEELLGHEVLPSLLKASLRQKVCRDLAVNRLVRELAKFNDAPNPLGAFMFWNRTRRNIALAPYGLLSSARLVFSPYLDHAVYDLLAGLPASMMVDHTFHSDAIRKAYPRYAHIPYSGCVEHRADFFKLYRSFTVDLLRYSLAHLSLSPIKTLYFLPRLVRCLIEKEYAPSIMHLAPLAIYLIQLRLLQGDNGQVRHSRGELGNLAADPERSHQLSTYTEGLLD